MELKENFKEGNNNNNSSIDSLSTLILLIILQKIFLFGAEKENKFP
jgi:hypothetical protein